MKSTRISNEAVVKATGRNWMEWFTLLDKAGARKMVHRDIARILHDRYLGTNSQKGGTNVATRGGWWSQMVTVEYERARGLRQVNEQADGFLVAVHKTLPGSVIGLQKKWNEILKSKPVAQKQLVRLPSKTKRAMFRYRANVGGVVVTFDDRGNGKARIMVETIRLPKKSLVEPARVFWKGVLTQMQST